MDGNAGCPPEPSNLCSEVTGEESKATVPDSSEAGGSGSPCGAEGMDRIRVRARTLDGKTVSMVGLLPREVLEDLKARMSRLESETGRHYHLEGHVKSAPAVEVRGAGELEGRRGLKVVVGLAIKEDPVEPESSEDSGDTGDSREAREHASVECETTGA